MRVALIKQKYLNENFPQSKKNFTCGVSTWGSPLSHLQNLLILIHIYFNNILQAWLYCRAVKVENHISDYIYILHNIKYSVK